MGGDAGGSEAAFSSMASDRASGIRRGHSTKVVARLSFGRAAPTRAQLIPFVSRSYTVLGGDPSMGAKSGEEPFTSA